MNNLSNIMAGKAYGIKNREETNEGVRKILGGGPGSQRKIPIESVGTKSQAVTNKILGGSKPSFNSGNSGFLQMKADGMKNKIGGTHHMLGSSHPMLGGYKTTSQQITNKIMGSTTTSSQRVTSNILHGSSNIIQQKIHGKHPILGGYKKTSGSLEKNIIGNIKSPVSYPQKLSSLTFKTEKLGLSNMNKNKGLPPFGDKDNDGVMNIYDCDPRNKHKQGVLHKSMNWVKGKGYRENTSEENTLIDIERYKREDEEARKVKERQPYLEAEKTAKLKTIANRPDVELAKLKTELKIRELEAKRQKDAVATLKSKQFLAAVKSGKVTPEMLSALNKSSTQSGDRYGSSYDYTGGRYNAPKDMREYVDRTSTRARSMSMEEAARTPEVRGRVQTLTGDRDNYSEGISTMSSLGSRNYSHGLALMSKTGTTNIPYAMKVAEMTGNRELLAQLRELQAQQQSYPEIGPMTELGPVQQPVMQPVAQSVPQASGGVTVNGIYYPPAPGGGYISPVSKRPVTYPRGPYQKTQRVITIPQQQ